MIVKRESAIYTAGAATGETSRPWANPRRVLQCAPMRLVPAKPVVDLVDEWAQREPDRVPLVFHGAAGVEPVSAATFAAESGAWAEAFVEAGLAPGAAVILLAHSSRPFISALLGAQRAGLLAVPSPPPEPLESGRRTGERIDDLVTRSGARAVVSPVVDQTALDLGAALAERGVRFLTPPAHGAAVGAVNRPRLPFAYCQFTSGSGGRAKGVLLTHDNLAAYFNARVSGFELDDSDVNVSWLPFFHDNGLVSYALGSLATGIPCHVMPPLAFVTRPVSWLRLITRVRGTMSTGPNFAYALCARKVADEELAGLDLSSWACAANGAETVTREAVEAFTRRFAPVGFRAAAMLPSYGLAETTLTAATRRRGQGPHFDDIARAALEAEGRATLAQPGEASVAIASVGAPFPGQEIRIIGTDGEPLAERRIGEVALRGPTTMHGYLPGTEGEVAMQPEGWLQTGDLGYLADRELFLVGRKKDLIIRAGRNYYPQDLEGPVGRVAGIRPGRVVAFAVPGAEREAVVVVAERRAAVAGDDAALRAAVSRAVFEAVRLAADAIVLVPPQTLPLTTSGKIIRPEARRLYLEGRWTTA
jgi:acyl-CoA synthetase (AMP-forming)/AMP-acid ligase II